MGRGAAWNFPIVDFFLPVVKDIIITSDFALGIKSENAPGKTGHWSDVDDAFAIYRMMLEQIKGRVNVLAIVVHPGNALDVTEMYRRLETLIAKMKLQDFKKPLLFHGPDDWYNKTGPLPNQMPEVIELIQNHTRPINIVAQGPATVIPYIMDDKDAAANVDQIYLLMGQYGQWERSCGFTVCGNVVGDFNFWTDAGAVDRLLELCPHKLYFTPFQTVFDLKFDERDMFEYLTSGDPAKVYIAEGSRGWYDQWTYGFECEEYIHLWDTVTDLVGSGVVKQGCRFKKVSALIEDCEIPNNTMKRHLVLRDAAPWPKIRSYSWVCPQYRLKPTITGSPESCKSRTMNNR